jgi:inorganic pyrophosphatase
MRPSNSRNSSILSPQFCLRRVTPTLLIAAFVFWFLGHVRWYITAGSSSDPSLLLGVSLARVLSLNGESLIYASTGIGSARARASYWHDIPLKQQQQQQKLAVLEEEGDEKKNTHVSVVCEVPRGQTLKLEVSIHEKDTPIRPDVEKDGKTARHYAWPAPGNYGMLPRTLSLKTEKDIFTQFNGDGDPLDAIDLSPIPCEPGTVFIARIVGAFALIDTEETDWKIFVVRENQVIPSLIFSDIVELSPQLTSIESDNVAVLQSGEDIDDAPVKKIVISGDERGVLIGPSVTLPSVPSETLAVSLLAAQQDTISPAFAASALSALQNSATTHTHQHMTPLSQGYGPGATLPHHPPSLALWLNRVVFGIPLLESEVAMLRLSVRVWLALRLVAMKEWFLLYKVAAAKRDRKPQLVEAGKGAFNGVFLDAKTAILIVDQGAKAYHSNK